MASNTPDFDFIVKKIRNKTFGIFDTVSPEKGSQSSSVFYGVSLPGSRFRIYILTHQKDEKIRNIKHNPCISFVIPLCHRFFCFLPFSTIYFQSNAEIIPYVDPEAQIIFKKNRILRKVLSDACNSDEKGDLMFIRLKPRRKVLIYKLGFNLRSLLRNFERDHYIIQIPSEKY